MDTTNSPFGVERVAIGDCRRMTESAGDLFTPMGPRDDER